MSDIAKRILVVDDSSFMRVLLKDIIKSNNLSAEVVEAVDGVEALKMYIRKRPDLVTLDVNMPQADGIQALQGIMKLDFNAKVVMVTAVEQKHIVRTAMDMGARDYILKPFDRNAVSLIFTRVLKMRS